MEIPWDWTGINCYGMGMGQINMSHGQPCENTIACLLNFNEFSSYFKNFYTLKSIKA